MNFRSATQIGFAATMLAIASSTVAHYVPNDTWAVCYVMSVFGGFAIAAILGE